MTSLDGSDIKKVVIHPYGSFNIIIPKHKCSLQVSKYIMARDYKFLKTYFDTYPEATEYEYNFECKDINVIIEHFSNPDLTIQLWSDTVMDKLILLELLEYDKETILNMLSIELINCFDLGYNDIYEQKLFDAVNGREVPLQIGNKLAPKLFSEFLKKQYKILFKLVEFYSSIKADKFIKLCYKRIIDTFLQYNKCYDISIKIGVQMYKFYRSRVWEEVEKNPIAVQAQIEYHKCKK